MTMMMPSKTEYCATADATESRCTCVTAKAPMITDGTDDPFGLHRPGWRIASGGSERDVRVRDGQRKAIEDAHAEYLDRLTNAWKGRV
jgi:hypothetical protein